MAGRLWNVSGREDHRKEEPKCHPYHPRELSFILLTHAHIDHSGLIPKLVKEGFRGKVVCTKATFDLCEIMLKDSGRIQEIEAEWQSRKNKRSGREDTAPLYTAEDAEKSLRYFQAAGYDEILSLSDGLKVRFQDAGHILGSALLTGWPGAAPEPNRVHNQV